MMKPTIGGEAIGHGEFTVEGLGLIFNNIYLDTNSGGDEFEEV